MEISPFPVLFLSQERSKQREAVSAVEVESAAVGGQEQRGTQTGEEDGRREGGREQQAACTEENTDVSGVRCLRIPESSLHKP